MRILIRILNKGYVLNRNADTSWDKRWKEYTSDFIDDDIVNSTISHYIDSISIKDAELNSISDINKMIKFLENAKGSFHEDVQQNRMFIGNEHKKIMNMRTIKIIYYWVIAKFIQLFNFFGFRRDKSVIPIGFYCYHNHKKFCKYYKSGIACTYTGFFGLYDACFSDQCKICDINKD
jgi:hypothetical protein